MNILLIREVVMRKNQYDLCADTVTLDYTELEKVALIAMRYSLNALEQRLRVWRQIPMIKPPTNLDAEWMLQDAEALATATTTYHYLTKGLDREEVIVKRVEKKQEGGSQETSPYNGRDRRNGTS
jgi:hypothetical protein